MLQKLSNTFDKLCDGRGFDSVEKAGRIPLPVSGELAWRCPINKQFAAYQII